MAVAPRSLLLALTAVLVALPVAVSPSGAQSASSWVTVSPAIGTEGVPMTFTGRCIDQGEVGVSSGMDLWSETAGWEWWPPATDLGDGRFEGTFTVPVGEAANDYVLYAVCVFPGNRYRRTETPPFVVAPAPPSREVWMEVVPIAGSPNRFTVNGRCSVNGRVPTRVVVDLFGETAPSFERWYHPEVTADGSFTQEIEAPEGWEGIGGVSVLCTDDDGVVANLLEPFGVGENEVRSGSVEPSTPAPAPGATAAPRPAEAAAAVAGQPQLTG